MAKKCWFWCSDITWSKEVEKVPYNYMCDNFKTYSTVKRIQQGTCCNCGKIYRRIIKL